jgi:hypothetical protein
VVEDLTWTFVSTTSLLSYNNIIQESCCQKSTGQGKPRVSGRVTVQRFAGNIYRKHVAANVV